MQHSVRAFREVLSRARALDLILAPVRRAPNSSNLQSYNIFVIDKRELLEKICWLCGSQRSIAESLPLPEFSNFSRSIHIRAQCGDQVNTLPVAHGDANLAC